MSTITHRRNLDFLLYEMFGIDDFFENERYEVHDREGVGAVLDTAQTIAEQYFQPLAATLDMEEPRVQEGKVQFPAGVSNALSHYAQAGLTAMSFDETDGGTQMPYTVSLMASGMFAAANVGLFNFPFLTSANANLIANFGTSDQKRRFLPPMLDGRWFGTMCLSETQAGSSLADITTRAEPTGNGTYRITGSKMWISGGDHELADNIVHLVLAKIPGGQDGVKGISLFLVPRYRQSEDAAKKVWNNIELAGLNHKMGQRGSVNCALNFGEKGDCIGETIGQPGQGLSYMFQMMNEARIMVGLCASSMGLAGYLHSLAYAKERLQGRHLGNRDPASPQIALIEHADVRRMLLAQKAAVEGAMSLVTYAATLVDRQHLTQDKAEREALQLLLELLTPVVKSWPSEHCLEANKHAIQILGGYGYTRDFPVERIYRDNRLNHIHEGAYAIHGLDFLGRKVRAGDGAALRIFSERVRETITEAGHQPEIKAEADALETALTALLETTQKAGDCPDKRRVLALATPYLEAFGHIVIAWQWLWQATAAIKNATEAEAGFYLGKVTACRYFFRYELPRAHLQLALVGDLDETCLNVTSEQFI